MPLLPAEEQISHKNANVNIDKGMKWFINRIRKDECSACVFFFLLKQSAVGMPAGESILTASSCAVATKGTELTSG